MTGLVNIEGRHQQIVVRQTPVVNPPHLIQPVRAARPLRFQPAAFLRPPRHASARNSVLKKSSKSGPKLKPHMSVPNVPRPPKPAAASYLSKQKPAVKYSQYVAPQQVRNERQVSTKNYNIPIITERTTPVNHKKPIPVGAQITAVEAHQVPEKNSKSVAPKQIRSERQVTAKSYNSPVSTDKTKLDNHYKSTSVDAMKPAVKPHQVPAKTSEYFAPKQIRSERQIPAKSYNSPLSTYNTAPTNSYKTTPLKPQPSTIEARQVAAPRQASYAATRRSNQNPIAITRYVYNSPTGEEQAGEDVFNYEYETENGIKQK